jgi:hypothetical protein
VRHNIAPEIIRRLWNFLEVNTPLHVQNPELKSTLRAPALPQSPHPPQRPVALSVSVPPLRSVYGIDSRVRASAAAAAVTNSASTPAAPG